jgi:hypothetical protein
MRSQSSSGQRDVLGVVLVGRRHVHDVNVRAVAQGGGVRKGQSAEVFREAIQVLAMQVRSGRHLNVRVFGHRGEHACARPTQANDSESKWLVEHWLPRGSIALAQQAAF